MIVAATVRNDSAPSRYALEVDRGVAVNTHGAVGAAVSRSRPRDRIAGRASPRYATSAQDGVPRNDAKGLLGRRRADAAFLLRLWIRGGGPGAPAKRAHDRPGRHQNAPPRKPAAGRKARRVPER